MGPKKAKRAAKKKAMSSQPKGNEAESSQFKGKKANAKAKAKDKRKLMLLKEIFAPYQGNIDDVPVIVYYINDGVRKYKTMMRLRKKRERKIAPLLLGENNVPVTPLPNPVSGPSHHILRLKDRLAPEFMVDLLIRDTDLYFIAFRRHRILTKAERNLTEEQLREANIHAGVGTWYRFSDMASDMPSYVKDHESIGIGSSHGSQPSVLGGDVSFSEMFQTLARYQDGRGKHSDDDALERAVGRVMVAFCEATRFRSIYNEVVSRMRDRESPAADLQEHLWKRIHGWAVLAGNWLRNERNGENAGDMVLPKDTHAIYKYVPNTLQSVIDDLTLVKFIDIELINDDELKERKKNKECSKHKRPYIQGG